MGYVHNVTVDVSRPGKLADTGYIDSFDTNFRVECLNQHWFLTFDDACQKMEGWRRDDKEVRPHSDGGNKPPMSLTNGAGASCLP